MHDNKNQHYAGLQEIGLTEARSHTNLKHHVLTHLLSLSRVHPTWLRNRTPPAEGAVCLIVDWKWRQPAQRLSIISFSWSFSRKAGKPIRCVERNKASANHVLSQLQSVWLHLCILFWFQAWQITCHAWKCEEMCSNCNCPFSDFTHGY